MSLCLDSWCYDSQLLFIFIITNLLTVFGKGIRRIVFKNIIIREDEGMIKMKVSPFTGSEDWGSQPQVFYANAERNYREQSPIKGQMITLPQQIFMAFLTWCHYKSGHHVTWDGALMITMGLSTKPGSRWLAGEPCTHTHRCWQYRFSTPAQVEEDLGMAQGEFLSTFPWLFRQRLEWDRSVMVHRLHYLSGGAILAVWLGVGAWDTNCFKLFWSKKKSFYMQPAWSQ